VEEHPFTISSAPSQQGFITFTIKQSGDYTSTIGQTKPGDTATIDGPYGRFSYLRFGKFDHFIMIAGGVGITPIMSCLRHMAATSFDKPVTLIWANRTTKDIFFEDELKKIKTQIPDMCIHHVLSDEPDFQGPKGYVTESLLRELLPQVTAKTQVMLCGPPPMMKLVSKALRNIGFSRKQIHTERFALAD
jgi:predicted ferric reductase